jgi:hypothetical protein
MRSTLSGLPVSVRKHDKSLHPQQGTAKVPSPPGGCGKSPLSPREREFPDANEVVKEK